MPSQSTHRLRPKYRRANEESLIALRAMPTYAPNNPQTTLAEVEQLFEEMRAAQAEEIRTLNAHNAAQDRAREIEWRFHTRMLAVKEQVVAQFGPDSDEVQALGRKKRSEYRRPGRRRAPPTP